MLAKKHHYARAILRCRAGRTRKEGFCVVYAGNGYPSQEEQVALWRLKHGGTEPRDIITIERVQYPLTR